MDEITRRIEDAAQATVDLKDKSKGFAEQFAEGIKSMGDLTGNLANVAVNAFGRMSDTLTEFIMTGKASFADFARSCSMIWQKFLYVLQCLMQSDLYSQACAGS